MTSCKIAVPQPKALHATLRKITETLAQELACPTQFAPDWTDFEWTIARAVSAMHGVSPLLSDTLRWRGPAGWTRFLDAQKAHTAKRHVRIDDLLQRIDQRSREAGIALIALKGAALHAMGLYAVGDRPMADIDLLTSPAAAESTAELLQSMGFHEVGKSWKERVFNPIDDRPHDDLGEHADNSVKIELHDRIVERLPWRITDASHLIFPRRPHPGLNAYPSKASLMIHLLLHAAGSMPTKALRLLQLHDLALLSSQMTDPDWDEVLGQSSRGSRLWWAFPPLKLTSRYYASKIPIRVLNVLSNECPHLLKKVADHAKLHDVSFSYLWVDAFPGIEWSQSLREMVAYAASRVRPSSEHIALREYLANSQTWANHGHWPRLSHGRRILRWITSSQARPPTMHAVRAALAQPE